MTYIYFKTYLVEKYINRKIIRTEKYINIKTCYFTNIGWRLSPRFGQEVSGWCRFHSLEHCGALDRVRMTCFRIRFGTFYP